MVRKMPRRRRPGSKNSTGLDTVRMGGLTLTQMIGGFGIVLAVLVAPLSSLL